MTTHSVWLGDIYLKIVIASNSQWYREYDEAVYQQLDFGKTITKHKRYIWVTDDTEMKVRNWELEDAVAFWSEKILEALV